MVQITGHRVGIAIAAGFAALVGPSLVGCGKGKNVAGDGAPAAPDPGSALVARKDPTPAPVSGKGATTSPKENPGKVVPVLPKIDPKVDPKADAPKLQVYPAGRSILALDDAPREFTVSAGGIVTVRLDGQKYRSLVRVYSGGDFIDYRVGGVMRSIDNSPASASVTIGDGGFEIHGPKTGSATVRLIKTDTTVTVDRYDPAATPPTAVVPPKADFAVGQPASLGTKISFGKVDGYRVGFGAGNGLTIDEIPTGSKVIFNYPCFSVLGVYAERVVMEADLRPSIRQDFGLLGAIPRGSATFNAKAGTFLVLITPDAQKSPLLTTYGKAGTDLEVTIHLPVLPAALKPNFRRVKSGESIALPALAEGTGEILDFVVEKTGSVTFVAPKEGHKSVTMSGYGRRADNQPVSPHALAKQVTFEGVISRAAVSKPSDGTVLVEISGKDGNSPELTPVRVICSNTGGNRVYRVEPLPKASTPTPKTP